jgi:hypothetical protein
MALHLVQIAREGERRVALVAEPTLRCLVGVATVYELAQLCLKQSQPLTSLAHGLATGEVLRYDEVYEGNSVWRLLPAIDVPGSPGRMLVSGTGLTHLGSARQRQMMHLQENEKTPSADHKDEPILTDSMKMFKWGVEYGRPTDGSVGIAPEWFYKGDGTCVRAHLEPLDIPPHAEDGGEEAELAGIYIVGDDGTPFRIGMAQGDEFSDHKFEKRNYLNLAGSKLRTCSLGPELVLEPEFHDVKGEVRITRDGATQWETSVASGEDNMCHSLRNLEHHHFKFAGHRQPGTVHVHFFGADTLSFSEGIVLQNGDVAEVRFDGFGRTLKNPIHEKKKLNAPVRVRSLG